MEPAAAHPSSHEKKMAKQLTGKQEDTPLHTAAREGNLNAAKKILSEIADEELSETLSKQNQAGETALYVASENGHVDIVKQFLKHYNLATASVKAKNGYDALHIAARQGNLDVLKELLKAIPELSKTVDVSNTTALHTAAAKGHVEAVSILFEVDGSLARIARSNGKTALHSAARNGHLEVAKVLLIKEPELATRTDQKRQTALHMAAKGQNLELVEELLERVPSLVNAVDSKGNAALHVATRKSRLQIIKRLLGLPETNKNSINRSGETALDTAERIGNSEIISTLTEHGVSNARTIRPPNPATELKQTVSDIRHGVHSQLEHTRQTRRRVQGIAKRLRKLHAEGLNNALNSTTVVAVLIATVAFAAIFTVPGQYVEDKALAPKFSLGEAYIAPETSFMIFFVSDSVSLFVSLAVVVVQTSVVVVESEAKKQMMAIINKLMWLACVLMSVAFLALSFVAVGRSERRLAIGVTIVGATILATTLGTMSYWVIVHRMEDKKMRNVKKSSLSRSRSRNATCASEADADAEFLYSENQKLYAI